MGKMISRVRFLPMTIFFATLMLTVKAGTIWEGFGGLMDGGISISDARAQQTGAGAPPPAGAPGDGTGSQTAVTEADGAEGTEAPASSTIISDPALLTQAEIDLLQQLAERREILDSRESGIDRRVGLIKAAETRIDKKIKDLQALQVTIEGLIKTYDDQQAKKMESLVKIYEAMKPKDAARIFGELDMDTLLLVAERMKERKLAPVMAKMSPTKAKEMTVELSRLRQLPIPEG
jgi:flagellar motility protein MotE (MotC chaperone)